MSLLSSTTALLGKELRTEFRSRELLTTTVVFILMVIVLFSFTFDPTYNESRRFGPGLLWLAVLFAASLMLQPCFLREQNNDTLSALRLSVSDPFAIFLAKLVANTLFLLFTEVLMLPVFAILYNVPVLRVLGQLLLVFFLGSLGVSIAGTALSAISAQARMRELLLPLLLLPLLTPVLVASTQVTIGLLDASPYVEWKGIGFLVAFDVVLLTLLWFLGGYLLEGERARRSRFLPRQSCFFWLARRLTVHFLPVPQNAPWGPYSVFFICTSPVHGPASPPSSSASWPTFCT